MHRFLQDFNKVVVVVDDDDDDDDDDYYYFQSPGFFNLLFPVFLFSLPSTTFNNQETTNIATKSTTEGQLPKETLCP